MNPTANAQNPARPAKQNKRRWPLLAAPAVALVLVLTIGRPVFSRWQHGRLIANATAAFQRGDFRSACLLARQAFLKNPRSPLACAILAAVAEKEQSPEAILWRQRIAELEPRKSEPLIALAATATAFGETFIADQALAQVRESDRETVPYHAAAAGLAIGSKQFAAAALHFQKAAELDPNNGDLRLNLATLRIALADPGQAAGARATLDQFRQNSRFRHAANRALLTDARRRGDSGRSMALAKELKHSPDATLGDAFLFIEELQRTGHPDFEKELHALQTDAAKNESLVYAVVTWMSARGLAARSVAWADSLPAPVLSRMPVPLALAEACAMAGEWKRLRELVADADWGEVDFLRLAFHARAQRENSGNSRRSESLAMWERATNATKGGTNALSMLARLAGSWGWSDEAAQAWWLISRNKVGQRPALKALYEIYAAEKNTRELYRVAQRVLEVEPANPVAMNNVAMLALLLGEDEAESHRLAEKCHRLAPSQPAISTTYAFSLHRQKRTREAIGIMKSLPESALADPSVAACYGVLLVENGEREKARPFLEAADRQREKLFPEEAAMVASALQRNP